MVGKRLCVAALLCCFIAVTTQNEINIAKGKKAGQVSTGWHGSPGRAVDGVMNPVYFRGSCTHTAYEKNPYWWVDLGQEYYVERVVIQNRKDCCSDRLRNVYISVGNDKDSCMPICAHVAAFGPGEIKQIGCAGIMKGRFVRVQIMASGYLTLCEVKVIGYPVDEMCK